MKYGIYFCLPFLLLYIVDTRVCVHVSSVTIARIKRLIKLFGEGGSKNPSGTLLLREWPGPQLSRVLDSASPEMYTSPPIMFFDVFYSHHNLYIKYHVRFALAFLLDYTDLGNGQIRLGLVLLTSPD